jgi:hypothetical protein
MPELTIHVPQPYKEKVLPFGTFLYYAGRISNMTSMKDSLIQTNAGNSGMAFEQKNVNEEGGSFMYV